MRHDISWRSGPLPGISMPEPQTARTVLDADCSRGPSSQVIPSAGVAEWRTSYRGALYLTYLPQVGLGFRAIPLPNGGVRAARLAGIN